jgi:tetratricopeptide (TPR) repeat protein
LQHGGRGSHDQLSRPDLRQSRHHPLRFGALSDFNIALNNNPTLGDAYLNRALVLISEKNPSEALAAVNQGIALGATNLQIAYYSRGEIEDDAGQYDAAYRDYRQALAIKPDYAPAQRQLARFKVLPTQ